MKCGCFTTSWNTKYCGTNEMSWCFITEIITLGFAITSESFENFLPLYYSFLPFSPFPWTFLLPFVCLGIENRSDATARAVIYFPDHSDVTTFHQQWQAVLKSINQLLQNQLKCLYSISFLGSIQTLWHQLGRPLHLQSRSWIIRPTHPLDISCVSAILLVENSRSAQIRLWIWSAISGVDTVENFPDCVLYFRFKISTLHLMFVSYIHGFPLEFPSAEKRHFSNGNFPLTWFSF